MNDAHDLRFQNLIFRLVPTRWEHSLTNYSIATLLTVPSLTLVIQLVSTLTPLQPAASFLTRVLTDPVLTGVPFIDAHGASRAGQLMEVCGAGGSGKTEILMQAAVNCALPRTHKGINFGGCESHVLLLDLDGKFDTLRLLKILTSRVEDAINNFSSGNGVNGSDNTSAIDPNGMATLSDQVYRESVGRFRMIRCHNSFDFLKALSVVDLVFLNAEKNAETLQENNNQSNGTSINPQSNNSNPKPPRRLLLVDNVAAFYWLDRASRREHGAPLSLHAVHHASAKTLLEISRRCKAPVIATKAVVVSSGGSNSTTAGQNNPQAQTHKDFLPQNWTSAVTQRLVLDVQRGGAWGGNRTNPQSNQHYGRGGVSTSFVARWELPFGRPDARYVVDGEAGITCEQVGRID